MIPVASDAAPSMKILILYYFEKMDPEIKEVKFEELV